MIYLFGEYIPVVHPTAFVHPQATVIGNVIIGAHCYIGPGAALRGDWGQIIIENGCNVQENCTLHMFPGEQVWLQANAHIGHGAVIHGATIGNNCMIGMNAVVMDKVVLGAECIVGALAFIKANEVFENRSVIVGNPAKKIKYVTDEMIAWKIAGTALYQKLPEQMQQQSRICEPLTQVPTYQKIQVANYKTWNETK